MSANKITYGANCHCGAVQLKFQAPDIETSDVTACNCSICVKNGYHNIYPSPGSVQWVSGYDTLKKYQFNSKGYNHKFCPNCGSSIVIEKADDASQCAVNVRMVKDIDLDKLKLKPFDGKNLLPGKYEV